MEEFSDKSVSELEEQMSSSESSLDAQNVVNHRKELGGGEAAIDSFNYNYFSEATSKGTSYHYFGNDDDDDNNNKNNKNKKNKNDDDDDDDEDDDIDGGIKKSSDAVSLFLWLLYALFPLLLLIYFLISYTMGDFINSINLFNYSNKVNNFYKPDLPSGYKSETGNYDDYRIEFYDLEDYTATGDGWNHDQRVLFCVPLRDAANHLPMFFENMMNLTYPHNLIDLAFLISDTTDTTIRDLKRHLKEIQSDPDESIHFGRINIYEKDFGQIIGQSFSDRHGFAAQGPRRKLMAIARNWLLSTTLRPDHAWVYWRDADVETVPATIIEDLMHHNKDVIVPNIWRPLPDWLGYEQPYDLNSWQESVGGLELAEKLDEDAVIVEGYPEYATWRPHLAYLRDAHGDPEVEMELDGIGGVSILSKGKVFKHGAMFPAFSYQKHAETEGFGKLCKTMNFSVVGLPHYTIWHIYEPSADDIKHMKWMAEEEKQKLERAKVQKFYDRIWKKAFEEVNSDWRRLKFDVFKNSDTRRSVDIDWSEVDEYLLEMKLEEEEEENVSGNNNGNDNYNSNDDLESSKLDDVLKRAQKMEKILYSKLKNPSLSSQSSNKGPSILRKFKNGKEFLLKEETYGNFPLNEYISGRNSKNFQFVKFDKDDDIINSQQNRGDGSSNSNNNNYHGGGGGSNSDDYGVYSKEDESDYYADEDESDIDLLSEDGDLESKGELDRIRKESQRILEEQQRLKNEREEFMRNEAEKRARRQVQLQEQVKEAERMKEEELNKLKEIAELKKRKRLIIKERKERKEAEIRRKNNAIAIEKELQRKKLQQKN